MTLGAWLLAALLAPSPAAARTLVDAERWRFDLSGDLKTFSYAAFTFDWYVVPDDDLAAWGMEPEPLMPEDPLAMGALDLRLKAGLEIGSHLSLDAQARTGASYASQTLSAGAISLGTAGTGRDEAVEMSWQPVDAPDFGVEGRVDRLAARLSVPHLEVILGRQPVSFGSAWIFTPMDLVAPFSPTDIDTEYKPGVDAVRVDTYFGMAGQVSAVAAYAGDWSLDGTVLALHGGWTFGVTDVGLFAASNRAEPVCGVNAAGSIGTVGWHGEATVTLPEEEDPFVRAVLGADHAWDFGLSAMGEVYLQTFGAADSGGYLEVYASERFARGEVWAAGRWYAAGSLSYEIDPLVHASAFAVVNLADPSAMLGPSLSWSAAENAELAAGAFVGLGRRPRDITVGMDDLFDEHGDPITDEDLLMENLLDSADVGSEFGMVPTVGYVEVKLYF
ncbi:MAG: hypothetical protein ABIO70_24460 [Pseudomonadota bacterium]